MQRRSLAAALYGAMLAAIGANDPSVAKLSAGKLAGALSHRRTNQRQARKRARRRGEMARSGKSHS